MHPNPAIPDAAAGNQARRRNLIMVSDHEVLMMAWHWAGAGPAGPAAENDGALGHHFPTQADAEAWLSESFEELVESGVLEVSLYDGSRLVYGPMSLLPDGT